MEAARASAAELEHMLAAVLLAHKPDLSTEELQTSLNTLGKVREREDLPFSLRGRVSRGKRKSMPKHSLHAWVVDNHV